MTNREAYSLLSPNEKRKYNEIYSKHPLAAYIDWQAFYDSDDGNAMNFVNFISAIYINDEKMYVLQKTKMGYLCYGSTSNKFCTISSNDYVTSAGDDN